MKATCKYRQLSLPATPEERQREHVEKMLLRAQRKATSANRTLAKWQAALDELKRAERRKHQAAFWPDDTTAQPSAALR